MQYTSLGRSGLQVSRLARGDPAATVTGQYWHHRQPQKPAKEVSDSRFQDELSAKLTELTGVRLF